MAAGDIDDDHMLHIVPASENVEAQYVEMMVPLYSYGCEKKVKKALAHLKGIYSVSVDFHEQKVTVWGICNKHDVLTTIRRKRKEARFWNSQDNIIKTSTSPASDSIKRWGMAIIKGRCRSLSWKAWKKVFVRSYSF